MEAGKKGGQPVHINVPLAEPLFEYSVEALPSEDRIVQRSGTVDAYDVESCGLRENFWQAERPMIVIGQTRESLMTDDQLQALMEHCVVLFEPLGSDLGASHFDLVLSALGNDESLLPDFVLYGGGTLVSKRLKHFLRKATKADFWEISEDGLLHDTFMHTKGVLEGRLSSVLLSLDAILRETADFEELFEKSFGRLSDTSDYVSRWQQQLRRAAETTAAFEPPYSQMAAVRMLEQQYAQTDYLANFHYANSTSVRLACIYSTGYVYCNRGVNGIEGSLSTAAGFSVVAPRRVICVIGDLSFFYDQNALWNQNLHGNLRILLLNNGRGGIFNMLSGLEQSPARDQYVAAAHHTSAEGICRQNDVVYLKAGNTEEMQAGIHTLLHQESERPVLLEVSTNPSDDERALRDYYKTFKI
jgi:2-succinyl-5-enolpyruvyl-6-hydroxy-3-cyclohexene-1-carboxylate synthase